MVGLGPKRFWDEAAIGRHAEIRQDGLRTAFRAAEGNPESWLCECRLSPLARSCLAPAENGRNPPFPSDKTDRTDRTDKTCPRLGSVGFVTGLVMRKPGGSSVRTSFQTYPSGVDRSETRQPPSHRPVAPMPALRCVRQHRHQVQSQGRRGNSVSAGLSCRLHSGPPRLAAQGSPPRSGTGFTRYASLE